MSEMFQDQDGRVPEQDDQTDHPVPADSPVSPQPPAPEPPVSSEPAPSEPPPVPPQQPPQSPVQPPQPQTPPSQQPGYGYGGYGYSGYYHSPGQGGYQPSPPSQPPKKKKKTSPVTVVIAVLAVLCCVSLIVTCVLAARLFSTSGKDVGPNDDSSEPTQQYEPANPTREPNENGPSLEINGDEVDDGGLTTREIVANNLDSTVVLTTYSRQQMNFYGFGFGGDTGEDSLVKSSESSGIVLSEDGYIITNSHCVFDEDSQLEYARIDVTMYDGTVYENAEIVGYDTTTDLAVIRVNADDLQPAVFGDSSAVALGDRVVTLGNSGGLHWSASQGILSGQARDVYEDTGYAIKCLQVDAVINPGSSGGPLLNIQGQVIGINSAKIVIQGYEGLGFSIPINEAKAVIDDLVKYGYVTGRVSLGITGRTVTSIGYEGFMIQTISSDSCLVGTEAQKGDIITHVDGVRVNDYAEMRSELTSLKVGDTVTLTLLRIDNRTNTTETLEVTVQLGESNG